MSTAYYHYHIPDGRKSLEEELAGKKLIGVRTYEKKKRCFTWSMHPGEFFYEAHWFGKFWGVIDEYGHMCLLGVWLDQLRDIDIMRYNRDEAASLE